MYNATGSYNKQDSFAVPADTNVHIATIRQMCMGPDVTSEMYCMALSEFASNYVGG